MSQPLLSIVIANYNYGRFLEEAIQSVLSQSCQDFELIIVDGGSTDNSVEIIKKHEDRLAWWVSEPDKGQSDAFNKGFSRAVGKYLTWLNADDVMPKGALPAIIRSLKAHPECEWFTGNMFRFMENGQVIEAPWGPHYLPGFLQGKGMPVAVYGPATIFTKRIFELAGGMKVEQHYMMDSDLWMRFIMMEVKQRRINTFCWAFRMHFDSKTAEFGAHKLDAHSREKFDIERKQSFQDVGYKCSRLMTWMISVWRFFDGSVLVALYCRFRYVKKSAEELGVSI